MSGDLYWNYVKLLCHFDGIDNSTRIVDERHHGATLTGNAAIKTLQSKFGGSSAYFDGTGDVISFATSADFNVGTQDFTLEGWVFPRETANANPCVFLIGSSLSSQGAFLYADPAANAGKFAFWVWNASTSAALLVSTSSIVYDQWVYIAVTRSNTTWRLFIDGVLEATATSSVAVTTVAQSFQFSHATTANTFFGYLDDFRLTVGVCRYPETFTSPTEPSPNYDTSGPRTDPYYGNVVLHCHFDGENNATTFVDQKGHPLAGTSAAKTSTSVFKFGGSSLNPAGSYVGCASADLVLGSDDFTIEMFVYRTANSGNYENVFSLLNAAGGAAGLKLSRLFGGSTKLTVNGVEVATITSTDALYDWRHLALCREDGVLTLFSDGLRGGNYAIGNTAISGNGGFYLGLDPITGGSTWTGSFDELRVTKGVARYPKANSTYAKPTDPFPDYAVQKLSGTVLDADNNPVAKTVRSYRSSDGLFVDQTVSDGTTGAFELRATDTTEHFVVVHDATKNALVYDHIVPVI